MPWYKIEANTGPGHQSHYLNYVWRDKKLTREDKQDLFEDELKDRRDAIGEVTHVKRLPVLVRDRMIAIYKGRIDRAQEMLAMLEDNK